VEEGRQIWQRRWPSESFFDLWPVRSCFQRHFNRPPHFLVAESNGKTHGVLALSWIEEARCFGHFPGETWQGKTWLEQNKIPVNDPDVFHSLLDHIPGPADIRYLARESILADEKNLDVDEIGYLFFPKKYGYSYQEYLQEFSGKSRKNLRRELSRLRSLGLSFRHDKSEDLDLLFRMNLEAFGEKSYFADPRFLNSFEGLLDWLHQMGLLRVTTVLLGGKVAAVDVGAVWESCYTVLAGVTHPDFPGVGKLINFHHLEWACIQRLEKVDFLCGDFGWKERFHLTPRPLYQIRTLPEAKAYPGLYTEKRMAYA
jgi:hypothetical protein